MKKFVRTLLIVTVLFSSLFVSCDMDANPSNHIPTPNRSITSVDSSTPTDEVVSTPTDEVVSTPTDEVVSTPTDAEVKEPTLAVPMLLMTPAPVVNQEVRNITYKLNGGTAPVNSNPDTYVVGVGVGSFNNPTREHYVFTGWHLSAENGEIVTSVSSDKDTDMTLFATWKYVYNITYVANNGTNTSHTDSYDYYDSFTMPSADDLNFVKERIDNNNGTKGYAFAGWNTKADGSGQHFLAGTEFIVGTDTVLYAQWQGWVQLWENGFKFAEFNIGATTDTYVDADSSSLGGYYTWGGTHDSKTFDYCKDTSTNLSASNDTSKLLWGSNWAMPSNDDMVTLFKNTTYSWCTGADGKQYADGCTVAGCKLTGSNGNSIFLPALGKKNSTSLSDTANGYYWTTTPNKGNGMIVKSMKYNGTLKQSTSLCFNVRAMLVD